MSLSELKSRFWQSQVPFWRVQIPWFSRFQRPSTFLPTSSKAVTLHLFDSGLSQKVFINVSDHAIGLTPSENPKQLPHLNVHNLSPSAETLLLHELTESQVPEIKMWTSLGDFVLPITHVVKMIKWVAIWKEKTITESNASTFLFSDLWIFSYCIQPWLS